MKVTYYLEVLSSWCTWVEPTWQKLQERYAGRVAFEWKIALMPPEAFPVSVEQCDWFYRRSGTVMQAPFMLNSGWYEASRAGHYDAPNLVAEAARDLGFPGDEIRLALGRAALREGVKVGDLDQSVAVAVQASAGRLEAKRLRDASMSAAVHARVDESTREFTAHHINQRPAFILTDAIGDKAVFSGLVRLEPLAATIDAMLADTAAYVSYKIHHGSTPDA